jgi:hypothetical protein
MSQKSVEYVIGRLVTDEALRARFWDDSRSTLMRLQDAGLDLTAGELEALRRTPIALWDFVAKCVHPRLQKIALRRDAGEQ